MDGGQGGRKVCATGNPGGVICHHSGTPTNNATRLVGGVQLLLNVETSVAGYIAVEVLTRGAEVEGMAFADADVVKGSAVRAVASWGEGSLATLSLLAGQTIQLRVAMADAKLFALRLSCASQ